MAIWALSLFITSYGEQCLNGYSLNLKVVMLLNFLKEYLVPLNSNNGSNLECKIKLSSDFGILSCPPVEDGQTNLTSIAAKLKGYLDYILDS